MENYTDINEAKKVLLGKENNYYIKCDNVLKKIRAFIFRICLLN